MTNNLGIIIPARINSQRLQGKLLMRVGGKSILHHTVDKALSANVAEVFVATNSKEIYNECKKISVNVVKTGEHICGTDRCFEANKILNFNKIINLQGDSPNIAIKNIVCLSEYLLSDNPRNFSTIGYKSSSKVLIDKNGFGFRDYFNHVGIYGFTLAGLNLFGNLGYQYEGNLEQNRIRGVDSWNVIEVPPYDYYSIDTKEDLERFKNDTD